MFKSLTKVLVKEMRVQVQLYSSPKENLSALKSKLESF